MLARRLSVRGRKLDLRSRLPPGHPALRARARVIPSSRSARGRETPVASSTACWSSTAASESSPAAESGRSGVDPLGVDPHRGGEGPAQPVRRSRLLLRLLRQRGLLRGGRREAGAEDVEPALQVQLAAGAPPHLAAGGPGQRLRPDQHHFGDAHLVLLGHRRPHRGGDRLGPSSVHAGGGVARPPRGRSPAAPPPPPASTAKAAPPPARRSAWLSLGGQLQVLRIVVPAAQDDEVLQTAGEEQLALGDEAEVPGAQEGAGAVGQTGTEGRRGLLADAPSTPGRRSGRRPRSRRRGRAGRDSPTPDRRRGRSASPHRAHQLAAARCLLGAGGPATSCRASASAANAATRGSPASRTSRHPETSSVASARP